MSSSTPATAGTATDFNVSLEPHLVETLTPLVPLLPDELSSRLRAALAGARMSLATSPEPVEAESALVPAADDKSHPKPLIPYSLLSTLSAWTRTAEGKAALAAHSPTLKAGDYMMISLLAGTRTSPEKKFPDAPAAASDPQSARKELNDRRAVTAVLNALLSIAGSGVAVWWAADKLRWRDEWKVLLALAAAIIVAASEGILYWIWSSRRSEAPVQSRRNSSRKRVRPRTASEAETVESSSRHSVDVPSSAATEQPLPPTSDPVPPASTNVQEHASVGGLRERAPKPGRRKGRK